MLILASGSPRRAEILLTAGIPFTVRHAPVDEWPAPGEDAEGYVRRLARAKAAAVELGAGEVVLAADTTVEVDGALLEKPVDDADAARMLRLLSGRTHRVWTGVCVRRRDSMEDAAEVTLVRFVEMSEEDIAAYIASGEPRDKAGGYAIQGLASKYIDRIEGCYFNVVGLPISLVWKMLTRG
jgi:septum formation protein